MKSQDFRLISLRALFFLIPTILIVAYLTGLYSASITRLSDNPGTHLAIFSVGMLAAFYLYSYNLRFSITFLLLAAALWGGYRLLSGSAVGEFDTFYYSLSFLGMAAVLLAAWIVGFGFARYPFFPWLASAAVFLTAVPLMVHHLAGPEAQLHPLVIRWASTYVLPHDSLLNRLFFSLYTLILPVLFYCIFIVAINEFLRKLERFDSQRIWRALRRSAAFAAVLLIILLTPLVYVYFFDLPESLRQRLQEAENHSADFLKKTYNPTNNRPQFDLQDYAQLLPEIKLSDETVFCTYIDNFFPLQGGGQLPLPVHFRRFVLNRYEPKSEKFVLDPYPPSAIPGDLFSPAIKDVPIGFAVQDSLIAASTRAYQYRKNISSLVYNASLDPNAYLAPNTGYSYQKLPVPPEDQATFTTAYQCSSLISIWNLPPFVYSSNHPELIQFKQQRAEALRLDGQPAFDRLDSTFMKYYTQRDTSDTLIGNLAKALTAGKTNPYDRVQSIVDYFTQPDENGKPRFTYTLKPGAPADPKESFMHYFLFENKKGYCTYFAGATTLLLRAAGIPCRVVVGYAIFDRSNKNSGWYWVYADQGHAWVEVYFPTYGWVDFDTTPSDDTEPSRPPKPDATPPQYAREPVFATIGKVTGMTADSTNLLVRPYKIRYRGKEYQIPEDQAQVISLKPRGAEVKIDDKPVKIGKFSIEKTMVVSAYSFDYELEKIAPYSPRSPFMKWFVQKFPAQIPVDEAIIVYQDKSPEGGTIFAVEGLLQGLMSDSSGVLVVPSVISYRGRDYPIEARKAWPLRLRPQEAALFVQGKKQPLKQFTPGDSMQVTATSASPALHQIKPYLATEPFVTWFKNSFPDVIPVDRITLKVKETPVGIRIFWTLLSVLLIALIVLLLLATLTYFYLLWRIGYSREERQLYWLYRHSLMLLNQVGVARAARTPLEYARETVDPQFGTQFGCFMNIYLKAKYSPAGLSDEERRFVAEFRREFRRQVLSAFSRRQLLKNFSNFVRTLRYLTARPGRPRPPFRGREAGAR